VNSWFGATSPLGALLFFGCGHYLLPAAEHSKTQLCLEKKTTGPPSFSGSATIAVTIITALPNLQISVALLQWLLPFGAEQGTLLPFGAEQGTQSKEAHFSPLGLHYNGSAC